jgi:hypothetical protein
MGDRRADETTPLAPRRSLSAPQQGDRDDTERRPLGARVNAAMAAASTAVQQAATPTASRNRSSETAAGPSGQRSEGARPAPAPRPRGTRRARLRLVHLDPWSVMKTSFLLSIAFGIVTVVAVAVVWSVLGAAGVWDSINSTVTDVLGGETASSFDIENYIGASRVIGFTMVVAVIDVILITAIATLSAFLYNLAAALLGGLEVTLAEDEL